VPAGCQKQQKTTWFCWFRPQKGVWRILRAVAVVTVRGKAKRDRLEKAEAPEPCAGVQIVHGLPVPAVDPGRLVLKFASGAGRAAPGGRSCPGGSSAPSAGQGAWSVRLTPAEIVLQKSAAAAPCASPIAPLVEGSIRRRVGAISTQDAISVQTARLTFDSLKSTTERSFARAHRLGRWGPLWAREALCGPGIRFARRVPNSSSRHQLY